MLLRCGGAVLRCDRAQLSLVLAASTLLLCGAAFLALSRWRGEEPLHPLPSPIPIESILARYRPLKTIDAKKPPPGGDKPITRRPLFKSAMGEVSMHKTELRAQAARGLLAPNRPPDSHYSINVTLSDVTSLDRALPDTRPPVCVTARRRYNVTSLRPVSVIIPFFNEAPSMLLRAVHSVLNRSPAQLIEEILLVDDMSYDDPLKGPLERYVALLPKVTLVRHTQRSGLIVARMIGARRARAQNIIFLDAHTEVNEGWLEPLLDELRRNPQQIIQPFIDGVDAKSLEFTSPAVYYRGALSWDLRYTWLKLPDHEQQRAEQTGQPFFSPTLVGCAIAMNKQYFMDMGAFDEGLRVWGGENLELAFRIWMCGGKITTVTCSRVGHVFKQSPNKFDGTVGTKEETVQRNLMRVADVWMDGMRKFFYATTLVFDFKRLKLDSKELASLAERRQLRDSLKCRNFEWYLHNIVPEMEETPPMNSRYFGEIMNLQSRACWELTNDYLIGMTYFCFEHKVMPRNYFSLSVDGLLRYRDKCVKIVPPTPFLIIAECPPPGSDLEAYGVWGLVNSGIVWGALQVRRRNEKGEMVHWCIVQVTNAMALHKGDQMPQLGPCAPNDPFLTWSFTYAVDFSMVPQYVQPNPV